GDNANLNQNLVASLEQTKLDIGFEDEVIDVRVVATDVDTTQAITTYTPSVVVSNPVNNDDRLSVLEALMTEIYITNNNIYKLLSRIENNGVKTI
ncbi:MAG: hypothetical protein U9O94_04140, partial [Nanoarchaeota archaeon]|nr:hypothetical protein [Nanoarchaeota archaeon]